MAPSGKTYAVTGATGNIGSRLSGLLLAQGHRVRAISRGGPKLQAVAARGAEVQAGSLDDTKFLSRAFQGTDGVFAMVPPDYTAADARARQRAVSEAETAAVRAAGVPRVVALSSVGAQHEQGTGPIAGLHEHEQRLGATGADVLCLRPAFFMENFLHGLGLIRSKGIYGSPIRPDLAIPMIATQDIAAAAAARLSQADFRGVSVHELLGPGDRTMAQATAVLGAAIGRPELPYVQFSYEDARAALLAAGMSRSVADVFVEMYRGFNDRLVRPAEARSARSTTPTTLEEWSRSFAAAYAA